MQAAKPFCALFPARSRDIRLVPGASSLDVYKFFQIEDRMCEVLPDRQVFRHLRLRNSAQTCKLQRKTPEPLVLLRRWISGEDVSKQCIQAAVERAFTLRQHTSG